MMRPVAIIAIIALSLVAGGARADDPKPLTKADVDAQLSKFDPRAVAAARHYYESPQLKSMVLTMSSSMGKSMMAMIAQKNPALTPDVQAKVQAVVDGALVGQIETIQQLGMVAALQTFTTDELVAVDNFYSSPTGLAIVQKMPQLAPRMGQMLQMVLPGMLQDVRSRLTAANPELKL